MSLLYAVGDVHGSLDKLRALLAACEQHAAGRPRKVLFLGDYIDRGPDSAGVIRLMLRLQDELGGDLVALKGNHEAMLVAAAADEMPATTWLLNGGVETLESYGIDAAEAVPGRHLQWMAALPLSYDDGRRFFVHAGVNPGKPLDRQTEGELLWIREPFLRSRRDYGRLIVHGHTPVADGRPELRANRLNLDTGAVFGGPLTAAVFDPDTTDPVAFIQAR